MDSSTEDQARVLPGLNSVVQPLLTDLYQITMAYAYWRNDKYSEHAVFDLFFRCNPFGGEFTVFAGLQECLKFLEVFHYTESDIAFLKQVLPDSVEPKFFDFLSKLTAKDVKLYGIREGTVVFPRVPLLRVEGPLPVIQLLETTLLTLTNYASLVATNAARYRIAAGPNIQLVEFGLRRAQGPDGGLSASRYAYIGGFHATSNVLAGKLYGIPLSGTNAHAFIMSYKTVEDCKTAVLRDFKTGEELDFVELSLKHQHELSEFLHVPYTEANEGELAAFISYAVAFPTKFMAIVDTYDVIRSGLLNFCAVALALNDVGYRANGIRIDSGDLAYLSIVARETFQKIGEKYNLKWFKDLTIVASNDINEDTVISLNEQGHRIDCFGIGTHLVTCQKQPALGCVFKLVEVDRRPCIKLSLDVMKVTIPGKKFVYRLYGQDGHALLDIMQQANEPPPEPMQRVLCRHPFQESKRAYAVPVKVENLLQLCWEDGKICIDLPSLAEIRHHVEESLSAIRPDIKRNMNPTPYKVSVSGELYRFMHELWLQNAPIGELT